MVKLPLFGGSFCILAVFSGQKAAKSRFSLFVHSVIPVLYCVDLEWSERRFGAAIAAQE